MSSLFQEQTLNNKVKIQNRLAVAPLSLYSSNSDGSISEGEK